MQIEKANELMELMQHKNLGYLAVSLGFYKTLFSAPGSSTSSEIPEEEQKEMGLGEGLVRMSVGLDNNIQNSQHSLGIDPRTVQWKRVMDMNDRALREIVTGLGGKAGGIMRQAGFNITAASEIMAILCLANDLDDLKEKMGNIFEHLYRHREIIFLFDFFSDLDN